MKRRAVLRSLGAGAAVLTGAATVSHAWSDPGTARPEERVVYRDPDVQLLLRARQERVRLGETIAFEVENVGRERVILGCHNPWKLQRHVDGEWRDVTVRPKWEPMCGTLLSPGGTIVERVTMTEEALEAQPGTLAGSLHPGRYRFVLVGTWPYLAVDFELLPAE